MEACGEANARPAPSLPLVGISGVGSVRRLLAEACGEANARPRLVEACGVESVRLAQSLLPVEGNGAARQLPILSD